MPSIFIQGIHVNEDKTLANLTETQEVIRQHLEEKCPRHLTQAYLSLVALCDDDGPQLPSSALLIYHLGREVLTVYIRVCGFPGGSRSVLEILKKRLEAPNLVNQEDYSLQWKDVEATLDEVSKEERQRSRLAVRIQACYKDRFGDLSQIDAAVGPKEYKDLYETLVKRAHLLDSDQDELDLRKAKLRGRQVDSMLIIFAKAESEQYREIYDLLQQANNRSTH